MSERLRMPTKYPAELRRLMKEAGIYQEKNEPLIEKANQLNTLIQRVEKELDKHTLLLHTIGSNKQEKVGVHPLLPQLTRLYSEHARVLNYLGLGNKVSTEAEQTDDEQLKEFMEL